MIHGQVREELTIVRRREMTSSANRDGAILIGASPDHLQKPAASTLGLCAGHC